MANHQQTQPLHLNSSFDDDEKKEDSGFEHAANVQYLEQQCDTPFAQCGSFYRIYLVLSTYKKFTADCVSNPQHVDNIYGRIYSRIKCKYDDVCLLNDFNHLMYHHEREFEDIYDALISLLYKGKTCDSAQCIVFRRHRRGRDENDNSVESVTATTAVGTVEVVIQQFLDRIHCYLLHSFDSGYRQRSAPDIESILDVFENHGQATAVQATIEPSSSSSVTHNKLSSQRFATSSASYQFGYRFFYHAPYKNEPHRKSDPVAKMSKQQGLLHPDANDGLTLGDLYIEPKFSDLKTEMMAKRTGLISEDEYRDISRAVDAIIETAQSKQLFCARTESAQYYELKHKQPLSKHHLIAAKIYCDRDKLQSAFTRTFWKKSNEESLESMKTRHRDWYWLARYLRECVECFGLRHGDEESLTVYHGFKSSQQQMRFEMYPYIKGACSLTRSQTVASNFASDFGILLELEIDTFVWIFKLLEDTEWTDNGIVMDANTRICAFDMQHISGFPGEQEIFTMGGLNPFRCSKIQRIENCQLKKDKYTMAIRHFTSGMGRGSSVISLLCNLRHQKADEQLRKTAKKLLHHQFWRCNHPNTDKAKQFEDIDKYTERMMDDHCKNIQFINFLEAASKLSGVQNFFFKNAEKRIVWSDVLTIFPNAHYVSYHVVNANPQSSTYQQFVYKMLDEALEFLRQNARHAQFRQINFLINEKYEAELERRIRMDYYAQFDSIGWGITVGRQDYVKDWGESIDKDIPSLLKLAPLLFGKDNPFTKQIAAAENMIKHVLATQTSFPGITSETFNYEHIDKLVQVHIYIDKHGSWGSSR